MPTLEPRKTLRPDSKGRITLGSLAAGASSFKAYRDPKGRIILEPQIEVPAAEAWLWMNATALQAVRRGLEDSAQDKTVERGSFAQYAQTTDD